MVLNKKGQVGVFVFMLAIVVIILALAWASPVNEMTTKAMNTTSEIGGMDCDSTTDNFVKAGCWVVDLGQGYFILGVIALAGSIIAGRILFNE